MPENAVKSNPKTKALQKELKKQRNKIVTDIRLLAEAVNMKISIEKRLNETMHRQIAEKSRDIFESKKLATLNEAKLLKKIKKIKQENSRYISRKKKIEVAKKKQRELKEKLEQLDILIKSELKRR